MPDDRVTEEELARLEGLLPPDTMFEVIEHSGRGQGFGVQATRMIEGQAFRWWFAPLRPQKVANAIATALNALPRLIAEVRRLREELEHGDYWQKRATEALESHETCPICFAGADEDHKDWCDWGKAEREVERLKGGGK